MPTPARAVLALLPLLHGAAAIRSPRARAATPRAAAPRMRLPALCVLDLDMCVWSPEMYELREMPGKAVRGELNGRGAGVVGVMSGAAQITLHRGALVALQEVHDGLYPGMRLAVASSADTPLAEQIGRAAMRVLEALPGVSVYDVLTRGWDWADGEALNLQIGRQPPLSSDKSRTHFPTLRAVTGVPYDQMLFFDDSLWSDHCAMVERNCPGVVTQRTPRGMTELEWRRGLQKFAECAAASKES
ncbi:hypothetical protein AB1Y20_006887 [Prymnesium parvum]|uniref:Magnesium-dependent phosphatase-1 n=1 Tax=Prymnesium parvum TaxID=97485 RepID=A0AB34J068_PRYPA